MPVLMLPTPDQKTGIEFLINKTLANDGNCKDIVVPTALIGDIMVRPFTDQTNGVEYCIVMDHKDSNFNGKYDNGFLLFITPNRRADVHRRLQLSAPHVQAETLCSAQTVKIMREIGAQSALFPGHHRGANQTGSLCHTAQFSTEPVEDDKLAFHTAFKRIYAISKEQNWDSHFIQFHGSASAACNQGYSTQANVFISMGTGNATWYTNNTVATQLRNSIREWTTNPPLAETPGTHGCNLIASSNIQGRIVNNVPVGSECPQIATQMSGRFLSIEQHTNWRSHTGWYDSMRTVFGTDCPSGKHYDSTTKMCVAN
jgi:hypothetical protein